MARVFAVFLLAAYATAWLQPFAPYLEYGLNRHYIADEVCVFRDLPDSGCAGKCYLTDRLEKNVSDRGDPGAVTAPSSCQPHLAPPSTDLADDREQVVLPSFVARAPDAPGEDRPGPPPRA